MSKSEQFTFAHEIAAEFSGRGADYRACFALALKAIMEDIAAGLCPYFIGGQVWG